MDELVASDNTFFVATGVTDGGFLEGVRRKGPIIKTHSMVIRAKSGTVREVIAEHNAERWF
jgi:fructose-1,6-bisphosphatase II